MRKGIASALTLICLLCAVLATAGCFRMPFSCDPALHGTHKSWVQPEVEAAWPPEGEYATAYGPYVVIDSGTAQPPHEVGEEPRLKLRVDVYGPSTANPEGEVAVQFTAPEEHPDDELRAYVQQVFADLGLPEASPPDWNFTWGRWC